MLGFGVTRDYFGWEKAVSLFPPRVLHGFVHPGKKISDISTGCKNSLQYGRALDQSRANTRQEAGADAGSDTSSGQYAFGVQEYGYPASPEAFNATCQKAGWAHLPDHPCMNSTANGLRDPVRF